MFAIANVAALILRRDHVDHRHFRAPTILPVLGAAGCLFLVLPWVDRLATQYRTAGVLLGMGVVCGW